MHSDQHPYRELHDQMLGQRDAGDFETLASWLRRYPGEGEWLRSFAARGHETHASAEDLWRLYALSRVIELMTLSFQKGTADGSRWAGPGFSVSNFVAFSAALGMSAAFPERFAPFDCEIVSARNTTVGQPISVTHVHWPRLMLGSLLIARAGVSISGGRDSFDETIASSSTLYWAYRRKTRPYRDLSHGWGSNSQWRTSFRRDYRVDGMLYFNVDGRRDLTMVDGAPDDDDPTRTTDLTREARIELLTNRCFISSDEASDDLWPFDDSFRMADVDVASSAKR